MAFSRNHDWQITTRIFASVEKNVSRPQRIAAESGLAKEALAAKTRFWTPPPKLASEAGKLRVAVDTTAGFVRLQSAFEFKFAMIIGVPKEIKEQEYRVALLPSGAYQLIKRGHQVVVERGAGVGAGYPDAEYEAAGAKLVDSHAAVFAEADLIVKVKEPLPVELPLLRPGQILFTYLHLAANKPLTEALMKSGATCIAYETIEVNRRLPLLEPMSEIAGRMSVLVGGYFLAKHFGGSGTLLGGVPGVLPGKVVVLGGGAAGVNAARMAQGLGADVTILEVDLERMRFLDITLHTAHTLYSSEVASAGFAADRGSAHRRGAGAGSEGAETDHPRHAAPDAARQRAGGHRD